MRSDPAAKPETNEKHRNVGRRMISRISGILRSTEAEHGQLLILAAGTMTFVLLLAAVAIDVGFWAQTKRDLQNDVDAMVLAGVREMPDTAAAETIALAWGTNNGVSSGEVQALLTGQTCQGTTLDGSVTLTLVRNQTTFLSGLLGIADIDLSVCATARVGLAEVCYYEDPNLWNHSCLLKIPSPSDTWAAGNTGPIRLDEGGEPGNYDEFCHPGSSGADEYRENIKDGSECSYAVNDEIRTKSGNMKGPTCTAISDKLGNNVETIEDVFGTPNAASFHTNVNCFSPRFGLIPIISVPAGASGSSTSVTITGFISVYIEDVCNTSVCNGNGNGNGNGNKPACVVVTPIKSIIFLPGVDFAAGSLSEEKIALRTIKLVN